MSTQPGASEDVDIGITPGFLDMTSFGAILISLPAQRRSDVTLPYPYLKMPALKRLKLCATFCGTETLSKFNV